jgi:hypothetical protein
VVWVHIPAAERKCIKIMLAILFAPLSRIIFSVIMMELGHSNKEILLQTHDKIFNIEVDGSLNYEQSTCQMLD